MNKINIKLLSFLFLVFISASLVGCGNKKDDAKQEMKASVEDTVAVNVIEVGVQDLSVTKTYSGSLEGVEQANIVTKIPERIIGINVKVGSNVSRGQVVIQLDKSGGSSMYYQSKAAFENAEKDLQRMKNLYGEGAISQQMLDGVQTQYNVAKANYDAANNTVNLTSPISGVVTSINVSTGDLAQPGAVLVTVANIGTMKAIFNAGESELASLRQGQQVEVFSDLRPELIMKGKIEEINRSANVQSRSFEVKAAFQNTSDRWFKPGMFGRVRVNLSTQKGSLTIPNESIVKDGDKNSVYVVVNNKVQLKEIKTGISSGNFTEVTSGLNKGDKVVTLGVNNLKDGKAVYIANK